MVISDKVAWEAAEHLTTHDNALAPVIAAAGICTMRPHTNYYQALVSSIIGQQLSVKAAAAIKARFRDMFDSDVPEPQQILAQDIEDFRAIGFSRPKARYIQDLALHILDGRLVFDGIENRGNDEIIAELTAVKGIGEWTAHMFLMFCMGRSDVLPVGDLGIRNGVRALYRLEHAPPPEQIREISVKHSWAPYESIASWYIWRSLDNAPD